MYTYIYIYMIVYKFAGQFGCQRSSCVGVFDYGQTLRDSPLLCFGLADPGVCVCVSASLSLRVLMCLRLYVFVSVCLRVFCVSVCMCVFSRLCPNTLRPSPSMGWLQ